MCVESGDGTRFALEAQARLRIGHPIGRDDLDGDGPIEPSIAGPIHLAHPPAAKAFVDFVRTKARPRGHRHRRQY